MVQHQVCSRITPPWWSEASEVDKAETYGLIVREFGVLIIAHGELLVPVAAESIPEALEAEKGVRARGEELLALVGRRFDPRVVACCSPGCGSHYAGAPDSPPAGWMRADSGEPMCSRACLDRWRDFS